MQQDATARLRDLSLHIDRFESPARWCFIWFLIFFGGYSLMGEITARIAPSSPGEFRSRFLISATIVAVLFLTTRWSRPGRDR